MSDIVDPEKDLLEIKCHDDYKWASITIAQLREKIATMNRLVDADTQYMAMLEGALLRIRDEPQASPRHAQVIAKHALSQEQIDIADRLVTAIKNQTPEDIKKILQNIREENED